MASSSSRSSSLSSPSRKRMWARVPPADGQGRALPPVALGHQHRQHLAAPGDQTSDGLLLLLGQGPGAGPHRLGEVGQRLGVHPVGLGQPAGGPGEVPHLAGVDHYYRQAARGQEGSYRRLQAPRGLQQHQGWGEAPEPPEQLLQPLLAVGQAEAPALGTDGHRQPLLADVDAHEGLLAHGASLAYALPCGCGLKGPGNRSGYRLVGVATGAPLRPLLTKVTAACHALSSPYHHHPSLPPKDTR